MKKINTSVLLNFINEATSNIIAEIDTNDYLKNEHLGGINFSADLLSIINSMDEQNIFELFEEAADYCDENIFVLKNSWHADRGGRDCYLFVFRIEEKFYSIYKLDEEIDYNVSNNPLPFCESHIFYEKQHELDTMKELKTPSEENPNFFNYSFYFINDLFLNN
tara:strand:- start:758 stop:1249 length:492 start_codon:yes stop_codon:yes gene_type:complete